VFVGGGERGSEIQEGLTLVSGDLQVLGVLFEPTRQHHLRRVEIVEARLVPVNRGTCLIRNKTLLLLVFFRCRLPLPLVLFDALAVGEFGGEGDLGRGFLLCR